MNQTLPDFERLTWYVLQVREGGELKAAREMAGLGHAVFLPTRTIRAKRRAGRRSEAQLKTIAVIDGYLFLGVDPALKRFWDAVRAARHVTGVVSVWRQAPVYSRLPTAAERATGAAPPVEGMWEGREPYVLRGDWYARLLRYVDTGPPPPIDYGPGDQVRIVLDAFQGRTAEVLQVSDGVAQLLIEVLGSLRIVSVKEHFAENARPKKESVRLPDS